jgi:hypothetical protein
MTNKEVWSQYKDYTRDLTELARKLAFAAAAICWFFKASDNTFPANIYLALFFVVVFFFSDILQGLSGALLIKWWIRKEEIKKWEETRKIEGDYQKPVWLDYPAFTFFFVKIFFLLASFIFIGKELLKI